MLKITRKCYALCTFVTLCVAGYSSHAEDTSSLDLYSLSLNDLLNLKVTVSSAFPENYVEASSSVTVALRQDWQRNGNKQLSEVLAHMPSTMPYTSVGSHTYAIRGYGQFASLQGIATLIDGVPINSLPLATAQFVMPDVGLETLDRIEVIRGPGSALYGNDAFHGVLSLSSFSSRKDTVQLGANHSSNGHIAYSSRISQEIFDDIRINLAASKSGRPDQEVDYSYTDPDSQMSRSSEYAYIYDTDSLSINMQIHPDAQTSFSLGGFFNRHDKKQYPGNGRNFGAVSVLQDRDYGGQESRLNMGNMKLTHHFDHDLTFEWLAYYWDGMELYDADFSRDPDIGVHLIFDVEENRNGTSLLLKQSNKRFNTDWQFALQYDRGHVTKKTNQPFGVIENRLTPLAPATPELDEGVTRYARSVVLQAKTRILNNRVDLLYGGRQDDYSISKSQASPRLGIVYRHSQQHALKFLYQRAFRAPTPSELLGLGNAQGYDALRSETIDTYELIYMVQFERWRSELVYFHSHWDNSIGLKPCTTLECVEQGKNAQYRNIGDNKGEGVEWILEGDWNSWFVRNNLSFSKSENRSADLDFTAFPKWMLNNSIGFRWPQRRTEIVLSNRLYEIMTEGPQQIVLPDPTPLKNYWRVDIHVSTQLTKALQLSFDVENLLDRENILPSVWNAENGYLDVDQNATLGLRYAFQ